MQFEEVVYKECPECSNMYADTWGIGICGTCRVVGEIRLNYAQYLYHRWLMSHWKYNKETREFTRKECKVCDEIRKQRKAQNLTE